MSIGRVPQTIIRKLMSSPSYESWSREDLIARLKQLDSILSSSQARVHRETQVKQKYSISYNHASYPRRKIALKFCYSGWEYNGLAFQADNTPLPTVEGTLYNALASCKLIDGTAGPEACGWERCGRTDRGVSSAGQTISLWVRSNIGDPTVTQEGSAEEPLHSASQEQNQEQNHTLALDDVLPALDLSNIESDRTSAVPIAILPDKEELRYVSILNRVLPPSIRILAWSPVSPNFSSRFNCKYRHYKYFFTSDGLDLEAMRDAASRLVGEHDFRNLCKIDPSKQLTSYKRKILRAQISPVSPLVNVENTNLPDSRPFMCVFDLIGTAFLYNQVRHIMAILFLVGAGLENPSVVTSLINTDKSNPYPPFHEGEPLPEIVDTKPEYQMADGLPLMLWECAYNDTDVQWRTDDNVSSLEHSQGSQTSRRDLYHQMYLVYSRSLVHSALDAHFLRAAAAFYPPPLSSSSVVNNNSGSSSGGSLVTTPLGGGVARYCATRSYTPLLRRKRLEHVDIVNERWRLKKAGSRAERHTKPLADEE